MARRTSNRSRDTRSRNEKIKSEIRTASPPTASSRKRSEKKRKARQRKYIRRRIILSLIFVALIIFVATKISNAVNTYKVMGYPPFRDEVLDTIGNEVFVSSSEGRSLSTAEKVTDFDNFYNIISRNYAVDELNRDDFEEFVDSYEDYRKKVYTSKTDQEYFSILEQYLEVLDDTRTFIVDKETYDSLFNYYRNESSPHVREVVENPQAVDRYKRLIQSQNSSKPSMALSIEPGNILRIALPDFKPDEFKKDLDKLTELLVSNPPISTFIIDLRENNSIDTIYRNKLLEILLSENFTESNIIFYRGGLFDHTLENIKDDQEDYYSSAHIKNDASKSPADLASIEKDDYMYYDELTLNIIKNSDYSNRKIYVLTNGNTANEAIKFAEILQNNGGYIVKDGLEVGPTYKDVIYNAPSDLVVLEHSGLILSINSAYSKNEEETRYLNYDQKINSKDPVSTMLGLI